jgi:hypothetical protein
MLAGGVLPDRHLIRDPGEQDIGLRATIIRAILSGHE